MIWPTTAKVVGTAPPLLREFLLEVTRGSLVVDSETGCGKIGRFMFLFFIFFMVGCPPDGTQGTFERLSDKPVPLSGFKGN